ncbi:putative eukaryotic initiation factor-5 [Cardiosporidium cionae]|uniref:Eukaryotic initiation factor-5 n=1 Tax=Cardiosporidium cionae TaxID=476202 RepID=A0ABQ7J5X5_9APIC|nr:putative eukaryotic initiation factor-5 [Cardiosporidium cionae]|eukprot:KAF8819388.1 putative eukaryotic initiation factor-5 [Cardiosporidium cionae]
MAMVNIPRDRDDPNYRYRMPRLISKIEGRGNGIRTNISNMGEIARALKRPPMYPTKFFGCELGAMAKYEEAEEKALVNGAHNDKDLVVILDKFIEMYVLCEACRLPEMDIYVRKNILVSKCNACGNLSSLDITHKAATYMIRNPPGESTSTMGKKKKSKEERRIEKVTRLKDTAEDNEVEMDKKEKKKKEKKDREKSGKKLKKKTSHLSEEDETVFSDFERGTSITPLDSTEDFSSHIEEGVSPTHDGDKKKKKKKSKSESQEHLLKNEELSYGSEEIEETVERLKAYLTRPDLTTPASFFIELRMLQVSQDFNAKCRVYVTLRVLFDALLTPESMAEKMPFIKQIFDSSVAQFDFLHALQYYCHEKSTETLSKYPYVVQKLYNAEVLEAEDILDFYKQEDNDTIFVDCKRIIQPLLTWFEENDSENEEEEEDNGSEYQTPKSAVFKSLDAEKSSLLGGNGSLRAVSSLSIDSKATEPYDEGEFHDVENCSCSSELDMNAL